MAGETFAVKRNQIQLLVEAYIDLFNETPPLNDYDDIDLEIALLRNAILSGCPIAEAFELVDLSTAAASD